MHQPSAFACPDHNLVLIKPKFWDKIHSFIVLESLCNVTKWSLYNNNFSFKIISLLKSKKCWWNVNLFLEVSINDAKSQFFIENILSKISFIKILSKFLKTILPEGRKSFNKLITSAWKSQSNCHRFFRYPMRIF